MTQLTIDDLFAKVDSKRLVENNLIKEWKGSKLRLNSFVYNELFIKDLKERRKECTTKK